LSYIPMLLLCYDRIMVGKGFEGIRGLGVSPSPLGDQRIIN